MPELAEAILAAGCVLFVVLFGGLLILGLELSRSSDPTRISAVGVWMAPLALSVGLVPVAIAYGWAQPRRRPYFPWTLLGLALWIIGALLVLVRLS